MIGLRRTIKAAFYNALQLAIINPFHTFKNAAHIVIALTKKRPFATIASIAIVMYSLKKARERYRLRSGQHGDRGEGKGGPGGGDNPDGLDDPDSGPPGPRPPDPEPPPRPGHPEGAYTIPAARDDDFDALETDEERMDWFRRVSNLFLPLIIIDIISTLPSTGTKFVILSEATRVISLTTIPTFLPLSGSSAADTVMDPDTNIAEHVTSEDETQDETQDKGLNSNATECATSENNASDTIVSTTLPDSDESGALEETELEELLGSVAKDINSAGKSRIKQDGFRTRYSVHTPTPKKEQGNLLPEPLRVRSRTETSPEHREQEISLIDFLKADEEYEKYEQVEQATEGDKDALKSRRKKSPFFNLNLKRMASSAVVKDSAGSSKQGPEETALSPVDPPLTSIGPSSAKPVIPTVSCGTGSDGQSQILSPSTSLPALQAPGSDDNELKSVPYGVGYTLANAEDSSSVPPIPPKSVRRRPLLSLNTEKATSPADGTVSNSPAVPGGGGSAPSAGIGGGFDNAAVKALATTDDKGSGRKNRSRSEGSPPPSFSSTPKPKQERFTDDHPEVKAFERNFLQETFGVSSTKDIRDPNQELTSKERRAEKKAEKTAAKRLAKAAAAANKGQIHDDSEHKIAHKPKNEIEKASTKSEKDSHKDDIADAYFKVFPLGDDYPLKHLFPPSVIDSASGRSNAQPPTVPSTPQRLSSHTSNTGTSTTISARGSSSVGGGTQATTVASTPQRVSRDTSNSKTVGTPSLGSISIRRKEVSSVNNKADSYPHGTQVSTRSGFGESSKAAAGPGYAIAGPSTSQIGSGTDVCPTPTQKALEQDKGSGTPYAQLHLEDKAAENLAEKQLQKENFVAHKVNQLRKITGTQIVGYSKEDDICKHPNHDRTFYAKNLFCHRCTDNCAVCDAPCCMFKGALNTARANPETEFGEEAAHLAREIHQYATQDKDVATFLECTVCEKWVCPECIGICPIYPCRDQMCTTCNPNPWAMCAFHDDEDIQMSPICQAKLEKSRQDFLDWRELQNKNKDKAT
ncbi:MAG: hypothetical protein Q9191_001993 [Dirinaria sp. TL-2023a]